MGLLIDGKWHDVWYDTKASHGRFVRTEAQFRNWVTGDGSAGPSGGGDSRRAEPLPPVRRVRVPVGASHADHAQAQGPRVADHHLVDQLLHGRGRLDVRAGPETIADDVNHVQQLYELYTIADPQYSGRATIPILWDKKQRTIVSNESAEIIRMLNGAFDDVGANGNDYYPNELRAEIDEWNALIYPNVNNGVYRAGFATTQEAYEEAAIAVFATLDKIEEHLATNRYLADRGSPRRTCGYSRR